MKSQVEWYSALPGVPERDVLRRMSDLARVVPTPTTSWPTLRLGTAVLRVAGGRSDLTLDRGGRCELGYLPISKHAGSVLRSMAMTSVAENAIATKLLDAAVRLFAHKGYPATSTREIVEAAGVTKPMLYYYFQSKEGLLAAAIGHFLDAFHERLRQVVCRAARAPRATGGVGLGASGFLPGAQAAGAACSMPCISAPTIKRVWSIWRSTPTQGHELLMQGVDQAIAERVWCAPIATTTWRWPCTA